jgi:hypothetical protein
MTAAHPLVPGHPIIEALLAEFLRAVENQSTRLESLWTDFERALLEHFTYEERTVLAEFLSARPREARALFEEHRYLRGRLAPLRPKLARVPVDDVRTFLTELRAHGDHEERVLYPWVEATNALRAGKEPG